MPNMNTLARRALHSQEHSHTQSLTLTTPSHAAPYTHRNTLGRALHSQEHSRQSLTLTGTLSAEPCTHGNTLSRALHFTGTLSAEPCTHGNTLSRALHLHFHSTPAFFTPTGTLSPAEPRTRSGFTGASSKLTAEREMQAISPKPRRESHASFTTHSAHRRKHNTTPTQHAIPNTATVAPAYPHNTYMMCHGLVMPFLS